MKMTEQKKTTRPLSQIDWKVANELLEAGCYGTEVASFFGIHEDTFYKHVVRQYGMGFTAYMQLKRAKGDSILRATQFEVAVKGKDKAMLIWLGKQRLNQREPEALTKDPENRCTFNEWLVMQKQAKEDAKKD